MKWKDVKEFLRPNGRKVLYWVPSIILTLWDFLSGFDYPFLQPILAPLIYGILGFFLTIPALIFWSAKTVNFFQMSILIGIITYLISCFLEKLSHKPKYFLIYYAVSFIVLIWVATWLFVSGPSYRQWIELIDYNCSEGVVNIKIRNIGTIDREKNSIPVYRTSPEAELNTPNTCCDTLISPGEYGNYIDPTCGTGNTCVYRFSPSGAKTVIATVACP